MRIGIFAIRDIKAGEALSYDYQFETREENIFKCFCESANCRGTMAPAKNKKAKFNQFIYRMQQKFCYISDENEETSNNVAVDKVKIPSDPNALLIADLSDSSVSLLCGECTDSKLKDADLSLSEDENKMHVPSLSSTVSTDVETASSSLGSTSTVFYGRVVGKLKDSESLLQGQLIASQSSVLKINESALNDMSAKDRRKLIEMGRIECNRRIEESLNLGKQFSRSYVSRNLPGDSIHEVVVVYIHSDSLLFISCTNCTD